MHTRQPFPQPNPTRRQLLKTGITGGLCLPLLPSLAWASGHPQSPNQDDIGKLVEQLHAETGLELSYLQGAVNEASFDSSIIRRMETPYEGKPYKDYRPLFVTPRLAEMGKGYLQENHHVFDEVSARYGVDAEIIAAILGMETRYGRYRGKDRVLDALFTLATGYPRRADFFRNELGQYLLLCKEESLQPNAVQGSYAGAFGTTQFIPSSYRAFAVDADTDGKRDVWNSPVDIIASVANYFHKHDWDNSRPVAIWLNKEPKSALGKTMLKDETREWRRLGDVQKSLHLKLPAIWQDDDKVALIQRETDQGIRTALVHYNFYVITRWNRSYNYALAASELAGLLGCERCKVVTQA